MNIKRSEFDRVVDKFGFQTRSGKDLHAWLEVENVVVARTKRSHCKGDLPCVRKILKQLHLDEDQFRDAADCTMARGDYLSLLREKKLIA